MRMLVVLCAVAAMASMAQAGGRRGGEDGQSRPGGGRGGGRKGPGKMMPLCKIEIPGDEQPLFDKPCHLPDLMECKTMEPPHRPGRENRGSSRIKSFCVPKSCNPGVTSDCPSYSSCIVPPAEAEGEAAVERRGRRRPVGPHCQVTCDIKLYMKACMVKNSAGEAIPGFNGTCPQHPHRPMICSDEVTESLTLDSQMTAHFCVPEGGRQQREMNMRTKMCSTRQGGRQRGSEARGGKGRMGENGMGVGQGGRRGGKKGRGEGARGRQNGHRERGERRRGEGNSRRMAGGRDKN